MGKWNIDFSINQKIEILNYGMTFKSTIQDIQEDYVVINMPISGRKFYIMHSGTSLEFYVCTSKEIFKCRSMVLGKKEENNVQLVIISKPEIIEKVQRREYFRLPISMEVEYCLLPQGIEYLSLKDIPSGYFNFMKKCITLDISGGGIKIITREYARKECNALVNIKLQEEICLLCTIVRCEYNDFEKNYRISLKYEDLEERVRDKIIKYIFNKLRDQSKLLK